MASGQILIKGVEEEAGEAEEDLEKAVLKNLVPLFLYKKNEIKLSQRKQDMLDATLVGCQVFIFVVIF